MLQHCSFAKADSSIFEIVRCVQVPALFVMELCLSGDGCRGGGGGVLDKALDREAVACEGAKAQELR